MKSGALLIRADANVAVGTGHVMRCLALAQAWQDGGGAPTFAVAEMPEALRPRLSSNGLALLPIEAVPGSLEDAAASVALARQINADWVVVDGDRFPPDFLEYLRGAGLRVLLIDDFADRRAFPADLIVNPNLGADPQSYRAQGVQVPVLTGPRYVLLRREFRESYSMRPTEKGNRVVITLGGSDPENLTLRIATALSSCPDLELTVVAGPGYLNRSELQKTSGANLRVIEDPQDMADLMKAADLAVIAAGGTLWELLAVGCAVLSYARNTVQKRVVESLANNGVVVNMGDTAHFDPARLVSAVRQLADSRCTREKMAALGRAMVDGIGAARVVEALQQLGAR